MDTRSVIDLPTFESLKESMGADFIGELVQAYFEETPQLLSNLRQALEKQNCEEFRRAAHSIKSTSNSFGALDLGAGARELEMMGRDANLEGAAPKVEALEKEYVVVQERLKELCNA
jgi:HPt (histidine-containing phosphotransfer) domain-containing protein